MSTLDYLKRVAAMHNASPEAVKAADEFEALQHSLSDETRKLLDAGYGSPEHALARIKQLEGDFATAIAERNAARFRPMGDNHHNAVACPYCNPKHEELAPADVVHYAEKIVALVDQEWATWRRLAREADERLATNRNEHWTAYHAVDEIRQKIAALSIPSSLSSRAAAPAASENGDTGASSSRVEDVSTTFGRCKHGQAIPLRCVKCEDEFEGNGVFHSEAEAAGKAIAAERDEIAQVGFADKLPCKVYCEAGLAFGEGVPVGTLLAYFKRREKYNADSPLKHTCGLLEREWSREGPSKDCPLCKARADFRDLRTLIERGEVPAVHSQGNQP